MSYEFEYNEKALKSLFNMFYNVLPHSRTWGLAFRLIDETSWAKAYTSKWDKDSIFQYNYLNKFVTMDRYPEVNAKYVPFLNKGSVLVLVYRWEDCDDYKKLENTLNKYQTRIQSLRYFRYGWGSKLHKVLAVLPVVKLFNILPVYLSNGALFVYIKIPWSTCVAEVERIKRITK